ncbi:DNA cytosine methyltransferase [Brucella ovis]|uniref:DNA cytosine methyltransferase n=1 Tax=Brucella ovis TaxID=236 RepID=UPI000E203249
MRAVELFCGAGGMSLGLKRAGIDVVGAYDARIRQWRPTVIMSGDKFTNTI